MVFSVRYLVFGVFECLVFGDWCLVLGALCVGVWCLEFGVLAVCRGWKTVPFTGIARPWRDLG